YAQVNFNKYVGLWILENRSDDRSNDQAK
ncbi:glycosyltransferase family 2 protein, partial [Vibrio sp. 10N.222.54.F6]